MNNLIWRFMWCVLYLLSKDLSYDILSDFRNKWVMQTRQDIFDKCKFE